MHGRGDGCWRKRDRRHQRLCALFMDFTADRLKGELTNLVSDAGRRASPASRLLARTPAESDLGGDPLELGRPRTAAPHSSWRASIWIVLERTG